MIDGGLHRFGRLQHFGDDQLVVVEQAAHLGHPGHQRAVDDVQRRRAFLPLEVEVGNQTVLGALDDVAGQAFVDVKLFGGLLLLFFLPRKCSVIAPMWNWLMPIFCSRDCSRQSSGAVRNSGSIASSWGVLNSRFSARRRSSSGIDAKRSSFSALTMARSRPALVAWYRNTELTTSRAAGRQPEADVGDAQNGLDVGNLLLDQADRFDGLDRAADVVFVARGAGEHQRIDDDVLGRDAVFFGQELRRSAGRRPVCARG